MDLWQGLPESDNEGGLLSWRHRVIQGVGPLGMCNALMARMLGAGKIVAIDKSQVPSPSCK